jgi:Fanconi anemia group M protein
MTNHHQTLLDFITDDATKNKEKDEKFQKKDSSKIFHIDNEEFIIHSKIKPKTIKARIFQLKIAEQSLLGNTLVVIPTGLGKTIIAALISAEVLRKKEGGKILFLAPTKPLVNQHRDTFKKFLNISKKEEGLIVFTGDMKPKDRVKNFSKARIIFSTPQLIRNDIKKKRYSLKAIDLLIVDEAHRAIGKYAYVSIAKEFSKNKEGLTLGLTASPGGKKERINEVLGNLNIKQVEARTREDEDVYEYVKEIKISWKKVSLTKKQKKIQNTLKKFLYERIKKLQKIGFLSYKKARYVSKTDLIDVGNKIRKKVFSRGGKMRKGGKGYLFGLLYNQSLALLSYHSLELLETQGTKPLYDYLKRLFGKEELNRAEKAFIKDERINEIFSLLGEKEGNEASHPKIHSLLKVVEEQFEEKKDSLILIFAQYRDTIDSIVEELVKLPKIKVVKFIGQASRHGKKGLSQEKQKEILEKFKSREYNILVASSVAEEGIDIPSVDTVIFYEPIPSEIRAIQRRGRTGRSEIGRVVILITEESKDEAYLYAEMQREKQMQKMIEWLKKR